MRIQVNTDAAARGGAELDARVRALVAAAFGRFGPRLTRVHIRLSDVNGPKTRGHDKRCVIEARPASRAPLSVTHVAATFAGALGGARRKMVRQLDGLCERSRTLRRRPA